MTDKEARRAFAEGSAVDYIPHKGAEPSTYEFIDAIRYVKSRNDTVVMEVELNERRRIGVGTPAHSVTVTRPEYIALSGAAEVRKRQERAKPQKHKYGKHKNVLLSDEEYRKLRDEFSADFDKWIETLSDYKAASGKKYANDLQAIRNFSRNEEKWRQERIEKEKRLFEKGKKRGFNNYIDSNKPDYSDMSEKILKEMLED